MTTPRELVVRLGPGDTAPDFTASTSGGEFRLSSVLPHSKVLLLFYPCSDMPGSTARLKALSDNLDELNATAVKLFAISCESTAVQEQFRKRHSLKLTMLSDERGEAGSRYGTIRNEHTLSCRAAFLIDREGTILRCDETIPEPKVLRSWL